MFIEFKRLTKHGIIYGLSSVLSSAIGFILLPLYTRYLTPADYGILEILAVTVSFVSIILQMGLASAIFKAILFDDRQITEVIISTAFYFIVASSGIVILALYFMAPNIASLILGIPDYGRLVRIVLLTAFLDIISTIPLARLRIREESVKYSAVSFGKFIVGMILNVYFLSILKKGVEGLLVAGVIQSFIFDCILVYMMFRDLRLVFSGAALRRMLSFGIPLVPVGASIAILNIADRYFLRLFTTFEVVGLYAVGYKFGWIFYLLVGSFQNAWLAVLFSVAKRDDAKKFYAKLLTYFAMVSAFLGVGISVFSREALMIMTTEKFYPAYRIVPLIIIAYLFLGFYYVTAVGTNLKNRTQYQAMATTVAAMIHLFLNYVLIPIYAGLGAAISTAVSFVIMAAIGCVASVKLYPINYEYLRLLKITCVSIALYEFSTLIPTSNLILDILLKNCIILAFPFILYLFKFYSGEELHKIRAVVKVQWVNLQTSFRQK